MKYWNLLIKVKKDLLAFDKRMYLGDTDYYLEKVVKRYFLKTKAKIHRYVLS